MPFDLHNLKFGVELEFFGMSATEVTNEMQKVFGLQHQPSFAMDIKGRRWALKRDGSVAGEGHEFVTPPIMFNDIETLHKLATKLNANGARTNQSCGMHVHVDSSAFNVQSLKRLIAYWKQHEDALYRACGVLQHRENGYTRKMGDRINLDRINSATSTNEIVHNWQLGRYVGLNITSILRHGTVEFRLFNGTMDPEKVVNNVILALSVISRTLNKEHLQLDGSILDDLNIIQNDETTGSAYRQFRRHLAA